MLPSTNIFGLAQMCHESLLDFILRKRIKASINSQNITYQMSGFFK